MDWIFERAKMFAGAFAAAIIPAAIKAFETASGFDIPGTWEVAILTFVTGYFVYKVPNKAPSQ